jgi:hypothetical membrane protein
VGRGDDVQGRPFAGLLLLLAAATILMGITTAEAVYPETYSTHLNEISDLGAPATPRTEAHQPSASVFNGSMLLAGASIVLAALVLSRNLELRALALALALNGAGTFGVGLFPSDQRTLHLGFAVLSFVAGGLAALLASRLQAPPSRYASAVLGVVILGALVVTGLGAPTSVYEALGPGGSERWISYPTLLWLASFGGYLMASSQRVRPLENRDPQH